MLSPKERCGGFGLLIDVSSEGRRWLFCVVD